jgi:hypothetical protein
MKTTEYVLWGQNAAYGPVPIKLMGGTYSECARAMCERFQHGGWSLWVNRAGTHPDEYPNGCTARQLVGA